MQKRFRQLFTSVKEHSSVGYAKAATAGGFCDVDLIIVKATAPDDIPLPEKYINELLKIFSISRSSFRTFSLSFTRRFGKTHCWRVALKCLLLLHRLLRALPKNSPFRTELLWTRSNSLFSLYPCQFRDESSSSPEDYTFFIRSYAQLLDEALDCCALDGSYSTYYQELPESVSEKMKEVERMIEVLPQLQSLIDRVMNCRPTGVAARSFIVQIAMKHIIRDSFISYTTFRREIVLVLDNLFQMPYRSCITAFGIYKKAAIQANQLCEFYELCKAMGFCGAYEYPFVDLIPQIQIQALEAFLNGMWQLTDEEDSSLSTLSPSSLLESPSTLTPTLTEDDGGRQIIVRKDVVVNTQWENFEENDDFPRKMKQKEEKEPLIQLEESENDSWEDLLEASVNLARVPQRNNFYEYDDYKQKERRGDTSEWKIQVYNPFLQPHNMQYYHGTCPCNPKYPWGL
ncbi:hypothetical protein ACOSQ2_019662 [Xanthoceras sorbifolium]|uniref:ENTH domain-containing protein n=1 Tax=Xanthoceras sorbifolium TaxID=99658 RepID=A0ABQ8I351_9ROSI|nr:hypothetical protein JRO89_XS05G0202900 [Xanthoceras sorbifolium]